MTGFRGRYVFVAGLHRSGTSLVARLIAAHPDVAAITGAPVPEQEGAYLQGAIPHTAKHGTPGTFAFDADQHLVEGCAFDTLEVSERLSRDWDCWYPGDTLWRVEKSPVNLLRMRLYQQLFPLAHFVIVTRHPAAVAQATQKWSDAPLGALVRHWQAAYGIALADMAYLHHALLIRYEDLCAAPGAEIARIFRFLALDPAAAPEAPHIRDGNAEYRARPDLPLPAIAGTLGYGSTFATRTPLPASLAVSHPLRAVRESIEACGQFQSQTQQEALS